MAKAKKSYVVSSVQAVAEFFGVSVNTVEKWIGRGMPCTKGSGAGRPGSYDLKEITRWRSLRNLRDAKGPFSPGQIADLLIFVPPDIVREAWGP